MLGDNVIELARRPVPVAAEPRLPVELQAAGGVVHVTIDTADALTELQLCPDEAEVLAGELMRLARAARGHLTTRRPR